MFKGEKDCREDLIRVCHEIYRKGWVAANAGNVSIRLPENRILCTRTGVSKGQIEMEDLILCDMSGTKLDGCGECTTEIAMHIAVYELRSDVKSVVHAHPPIATGFAAAGRALNKALLPEVIISLGAVPLAPYGTPGTPALSNGMRKFIPEYDAILLENHGCTSYGPSVWEAFYRMETVENFAQVTLVAELLGGARSLPRQEVAKLFAARERYRVASRNRMQPGMPLTDDD